MVRQDKPSVDLRKEKIGVRQGTTAERFLRDTLDGNAAMRSESNEELYQALAAGTLDGVIDDSPIAQYFAASDARLRYAHGFKGTDAAYGIAVRKGNDSLRDELNGGYGGVGGRWHLGWSEGSLVEKLTVSRSAACKPRQCKDHLYSRDGDPGLPDCDVAPPQAAGGWPRTVDARGR